MGTILALRWRTEALADGDVPLIVALTEEGLSVREIAARSDLSKSGVHRLQRIARLKGLLRGRYYNGMFDEDAIPRVPVPECGTLGQLGDETFAAGAERFRRG